MLVLGLSLDVLGWRFLMITVGLTFPALSIFLHKMERVEKNYPLRIKSLNNETNNEENK